MQYYNIIYEVENEYIKNVQKYEIKNIIDLLIDLFFHK